MIYIKPFKDKFFEYRQDRPSPLFGESFVTNNLKDRVDLEDFNNKVYVTYSNKTLGALTIQANHSFYDYGYNSVLIREDERIPNKIQGNIFAAGAGYKNKLGGFELDGKVEANISGDFSGFNFRGTAGYTIDDEASFEASLKSNSRPANYNHLLYQSSYSNYNWFNEPSYNNVKTNTLEFKVQSEKYVDASASFTNIDDYAYFAIDPSDDLINSFQSNETVSYLKIKVNKDLHWRNFGLDNTIAYQNVSSGQNVFNVPELVTRNSLYYTDRWFDKALFIQTGVTFKYFTKYNMNAYDPVLAEFYVQNDQELGGFPLLDLFFNMKVRQTRIFFIAEHFNSPYTGNDFFSAPGYPYRDFNIRFGVVWNFFL